MVWTLTPCLHGIQRDKRQYNTLLSVVLSTLDVTQQIPDS